MIEHPCKAENLQVNDRIDPLVSQQCQDKRFCQCSQKAHAEKYDHRGNADVLAVSLYQACVIILYLCKNGVGDAL